LELLLNSLVFIGLSHEAASVDGLTTVLEIEHEIWRERQLITWFGDISLENDVDAMMNQVRVGILRAHKVRTTDYNLTHLLMLI
jgi:sister chromatid cohesion protein DCC1